MKRNKFILLTLSVVVINLMLDRITKMLAVTFLKGQEQISLFFNTIIIVYVENTGAFLSMGSDWMLQVKYLILLILPLVVCFYGLYYILFKERNLVRAVLFSTIIGGGLGNLIDRLFNNFSVIDFLNFGIGPVFRTGIVNLADISVTFGVLILIVYEMYLGKKNNTDEALAKIKST